MNQTLSPLRQTRNAALTAAAATALLCCLAMPAAASDEGLTGSVGLGVAAFPDYEGAKDYRVLPFPVLDLKYGRFFATVGDGIGVYAVDSEAFQAGISATFAAGRRGRDVPDGIGRIKDAIAARSFARLNLGQASITAGVQKTFGGTDGVIVDLGIGYSYPVSERLMVIPSVTVHWANDKHMSNYFGISAAQSRASGLPAFDADAGIKDVTSSLTAIYKLNERWHVGAIGVLTRYTGDAADTPLNERKWQPMGMLSLGYSF